MQQILNNPILLIVSVLTILNTVLLVALIRQFLKYRKKQSELLRGEEVGDIEGIVLRHKKRLSNHAKNLKELGEILSELVENNKFNIQKIGVIRYNPFKDTGSNMSFVIALLDSYLSGIVISSLHSREGTRIYAKPIDKGESKHALTDEEREAIEKASNSSK